MRKFFCIILFSVLILQISVVGFAVELDILEYRDGNTYLGEFNTDSLDESVASDFVDLVTSPTSLIVYSEDTEHVCIVDIVSTSNVEISVNSSGLCNIAALSSGEGFRGQIWEKSGNEWFLNSYLSQTPDTTMRNVILVGGLALDDIDILYSDGMDNTYIADIEGSLILVDNSDDSSSGGTSGGGASGGEDSGGEDTENGGILGFLGDFWNKFKDFLLNLFIPSDGFFTNWFNEIKAAFSAKLGAISDFYNSITGFFSSVKPSEVNTSYFPLELWGDFFSWLRSVITGLIILLTFWVCYKRLVSLLSE